jgi:flavin-dependent dehydrogenase
MIDHSPQWGPGMSRDIAHFDVIIIGGGPAGATAGIVLARAGKRVLILEKAVHPRFHIGESFLPQNLGLMKELGLEDRFRDLPHVVKWGAEFGFGHNDDDQTSRFHFRDTLEDGCRETYNIERAPYDAMLLAAAGDAGVEVRQDTRVDEIVRLGEGNVAVRCDDQVYSARWLLDASGQSTVVGRHLGTRKVVTSLQNVAYFGHFTGCQRLGGEEAGHPTIVMCREGWFWMIPINPTVTSCGMVLNRDVAKGVGVPADQMLRWGIERCPLIRRRTRGATFPARNGTIADFSYRCEPYAGPGYFLIGDAATFIDPIFSTGACLGMMYARHAAEQIIAVDAGRLSSQRAGRQYIRFVEGSARLIFRLVHHYYRHTFRELLMNGQGPMKMHKAVISLLAGHVFPRPRWPVIWRFWAFEACVRLQKWIPLVPRHPVLSLLEQPDPLAEDQLVEAAQPAG